MLYEDYSLLRRYFENPSAWSPGVAWTPDDITAVIGHPNYVNSIVYNTAIGVCDYRRPAVADADTVPWMTYANGPGGRPLGPPPVSRSTR